MPRALLAACLLLLAGAVAASDAAVSVEVEAGKTKSVRLRNVPGGAAMAVRITTSGRIQVALVSVRNATALFRGVVQRRMAFRVSIPERGDYLLVLSNRAGTEPLAVQAEIRAVPAAKPGAPRGYSPRPEKASMSPSDSSI